MDKFFFSEKNVARQSTTLERHLNIKDNPDAKKKCKKLLVQQMKSVYGNYGSKKPSNMKPNEFLDRLNKKSISECVRICEENKAKRNGYSPDKLGELERSREEEMYGKREIQVQKRPQYSVGNKGQNQNQNRDENQKSASLMGFNDDGGGNFAPFQQGNGGYITADGRMGNQMYFGNLEDQMYGKKSDSKDDLERLIGPRPYEEPTIHDVEDILPEIETKA